MLHGRPVLFRVTLTLLSWYRPAHVTASDRVGCRFETSLCNCPTFEDIFEALKQTPPCEFDADALVKDAMGNKYFSEQQFNQLWTDKFDTYVAQLDRRVVVGNNLADSEPVYAESNAQAEISRAPKHHPRRLMRLPSRFRCNAA